MNLDLFSIVELRKKLQDCPVSKIDTLIKKIERIKEERLEQELKRLQEEQNRQERFIELNRQLQNPNLTPAERNQLWKDAFPFKNKHRPRYRYVGVDGQTYTWAGHGQMPKTLQALIARDNTEKEDYLIS